MKYRGSGSASRTNRIKDPNKRASRRGPGPQKGQKFLRGRVADITGFRRSSCQITGAQYPFTKTELRREMRLGEFTRAQAIDNLMYRGLS
jgi:hypothetical protein